jgi:hypothetical protein
MTSTATAAEIAAAVTAADGNITAAAAALGMSRTTLRRRIALSQAEAAAPVAAPVVEARHLSIAPPAAEAPAAGTHIYSDQELAAQADAAPAGRVSPVRFYAILMDRNLAAAGLTEGNVRNWFRKLVMGFPALNVTDDGIVHAAPVDVDGKRVSHPVVSLEAGIVWYAAYLARDAARAAARLAA